MGSAPAGSSLSAAATAESANLTGASRAVQPGAAVQSPRMGSAPARSSLRAAAVNMDGATKTSLATAQAEADHAMRLPSAIIEERKAR
jgi:hypothetical protein